MRGSDTYEKQGIYPIVVNVTGPDGQTASGWTLTALGLGNLLGDQPDLVASNDSYAELTAGWLWSSHNLNPLADAWNISGITRRINGPRMLGLSVRLGYSRRSLKS